MVSKDDLNFIIECMWAIRGSYGEIVIEDVRPELIAVAQDIENENAAKAAQNFLIVLNCTIAAINTEYSDFVPKRVDVKKIIKRIVPGLVKMYPFRKVPGREKAIIYKNVLRKITTQEDLFI